MARKVLANLSLFLNRIDDAITNILYRSLQKGLYPALDCGSPCIPRPSFGFSLKEIMDNGFVWGVPKHRTPYRRLQNRKFGYPQHVWKPFKIKTNIMTCRTCGQYHEINNICNYCWEKVKEETKIMQEAIDKEFHLDPIKEGVVVCYQGEKENKPEEWWKGKRIVELPKKRPSFFGYNLLEPSTQGTSESKDIAKPEDLA